MGWCGVGMGWGRGYPILVLARGTGQGGDVMGQGGVPCPGPTRYPLPLLLWMDKQSENITFPHILYTGGKIEMK